MKKEGEGKEDRPKAPMKRLSIGIMSFIIVAVSATTFYLGMGIKDEKVQDLNQQLMKQEAEFDIMVEDRVQQARLETQQEMSKQIEVLNQELEEEQQAYQDLINAMDDLKQTYDELMNTVFGPTSSSFENKPDVVYANAQDNVIPNDPRGYWMNEIIAPELDIMNNWYYGGIINAIYSGELSNYSYQRLIDTGRKLVLNQSIFPCSEDYMKAAVVAYCGFKWDRWLAQMNYTQSQFYGEGLGCIAYLTERGVPWEYGLIVLEFESNFGVGAPGNPWGFIGGSSGIELFCDFAAGHTGSVYEFVEWYHNPDDAGHETYRFNFQNRMIQIQAFCP